MGAVPDELLQRGAADGKRPIDEDNAATVGEHVEQHELCGRVGSQLVDAALRRMKPHLQCVEGILAGRFNHDLAIDNEARRDQAAQHFLQLGKITAQRLARFGADVDCVA